MPTFQNCLAGADFMHEAIREAFSQAIFPLHEHLLLDITSSGPVPKKRHNASHNQLQLTTDYSHSLFCMCNMKNPPQPENFFVSAIGPSSRNHFVHSGMGALGTVPLTSLLFTDCSLDDTRHTERMIKRRSKKDGGACLQKGGLHFESVSSRSPLAVCIVVRSC